MIKADDFQIATFYFTLHVINVHGRYLEMRRSLRTLKRIVKSTDVQYF